MNKFIVAMLASCTAVIIVLTIITYGVRRGDLWLGRGEGTETSWLEVKLGLCSAL